MLITRTPRLSAARGFSPAERSRSPSTVRFSTHQAATPSAMVRSTTGEIAPSSGTLIVGGDWPVAQRSPGPEPGAEDHHPVDADVHDARTLVEQRPEGGEVQGDEGSDHRCDDGDAEELADDLRHVRGSPGAGAAPPAGEPARRRRRWTG